MTDSNLGKNELQFWRDVIRYSAWAVITVFIFWTIMGLMGYPQ